ncbi:hypothetical protein [Candidatus Halocynthiibacter alkanivorans]|uniref:hypothetical protein n=1 Tax=Candidatus Halocynthiibacter alkanivorans TaxID=2267619 RepID=UPI00109D4AED|nr:hypothetical protein [Candidatus Halocynthiibacter alkanivorans]
MRTSQIGVDHIIALVVSGEDWLRAMCPAEIGINPFSEALEMVVVVVSKERRDDILHGLPQGVHKLRYVDQNIALNRWHRPGNDGETVRTLIKMPGTGAITLKLEGPATAATNSATLAVCFPQTEILLKPKFTMRITSLYLLTRRNLVGSGCAKTILEHYYSLPKIISSGFKGPDFETFSDLT